MTSSNGNIFRVTGPSWGKPPVPVGFPSQRPVAWSFDVWSPLEQTVWANNRDTGDLRRHHAHYDVTVMFIVSSLCWSWHVDHVFRIFVDELWYFYSSIPNQRKKKKGGGGGWCAVDNPVFCPIISVHLLSFSCIFRSSLGALVLYPEPRHKSSGALSLNYNTFCMEMLSNPRLQIHGNIFVDLVRINGRAAYISHTDNYISI